jgi:EmrB/QacA subfamily drug resistance transporter
MDPVAPAIATIHPRRWWTLAVLCLSLVVIGIDNTILNVALPTLVEDLGATASQQQWMVDTYVLVFASLLLTAGMLADRYGRRGALQLGLVVFGLGSAAAAFAGSAGSLIAARGVMGIGGAMIMPSTLSILTNVFTDAQERARAIGVWAGVAGLGIAIGPVTGGWLLEHFWWGSVFLVNLPVVAVALLAGRLLVPTSRDPAPRRLDPAGTVLSFAGLAGVLYGIIEAPAQGWTHGPVLAAFVAGVAVLAAFVAWERHTDHPMLDMRFFRNPRFSGASVAIMLVFFALFGTIFFLTQYLQFVLGYGTLRAGLAIAPTALVLMVSAPLAPVLTARVGTKVMVATGLAIVAAGLVILSTAGVNSGYGPVLATIVVLGVGMGLAMAPATDSIMGSLPRAQAGVGSAVNDTTRMVGGLLGVAILGSLLSAGYHATIDGSAAVARLPTSAASAARDSLGGAVAASARVGAAGGPILDDARHAFVHAMGHAVLAGAAVALVGALLALVWLPARAPSEGTDIDASAAGEPAMAAAAGGQTARAGQGARRREPVAVPAQAGPPPSRVELARVAVGVRGVEAQPGETLTPRRSSVDAAVRRFEP